MTGANVAPRVRLVAGADDHVRALANRLRAIDRLECHAMGQGTEQALRCGLAASARTWTALVGGEPHAMFGIVVLSADGSDGVPWFLGSDTVRCHARELIAQGPAILAEMHRHARRLCNFVSSDNRQAIRLLKHWGFTVDQEQVVTRKVAFRRFSREIK